MNSKFIKCFKEQIFRQGWLRKDQETGLVVGVSGGSDSVGLVRLLLSLGPRYKLRLHLVHVNYQVRGQASEQDEQLVRDLAQEFQLSLSVFKFEEDSLRNQLDLLNPPSPLYKRGYRKDSHWSTFSGNSNQEEVFRNFRYQKFEQVRKQEGLDWIAVAHTKDDQAETVLINLLRGAGLRGLGGMKLRTDRVIRPLLTFTKLEIRDFLGELDQRWREDQSNQDFSFLRNQVRGELIPFLEESYQSQIKDRLVSLSQIAKEAEEYIEENIQTQYTKIVLEKSDFFEVNLKCLKKISKSTRALILRKVILQLKGNLRNLSKQHLAELEKIIFSAKGKNQQLNFSGIQVKREGEGLLLFKKDI